MSGGATGGTSRYKRRMADTDDPEDDARLFLCPPHANHHRRGNATVRLGLGSDVSLVEVKEMCKLCLGPMNHLLSNLRSCILCECETLQTHSKSPSGAYRQNVIAGLFDAVSALGRPLRLTAARSVQIAGIVKLIRVWASAFPEIRLTAAQSTEFAKRAGHAVKCCPQDLSVLDAVLIPFHKPNGRVNFAGLLPVSDQTPAALELALANQACLAPIGVQDIAVKHHAAYLSMWCGCGSVHKSHKKHYGVDFLTNQVEAIRVAGVTSRRHRVSECPLIWWRRPDPVWSLPANYLKRWTAVDGGNLGDHPSFCLLVETYGADPWADFLHVMRSTRREWLEHGNKCERLGRAFTTIMMEWRGLPPRTLLRQLQHNTAFEMAYRKMYSGLPKAHGHIHMYDEADRHPLWDPCRHRHTSGEYKRFTMTVCLCVGRLWHGLDLTLQHDYGPGAHPVPSNVALLNAVDLLRMIGPLTRRECTRTRRAHDQAANPMPLPTHPVHNRAPCYRVGPPPTAVQTESAGN